MTDTSDQAETTEAADDLEFVASVEELDEGERIIVEVKGLEIQVLHTDGEYYAIGNYCPHQLGPLAEGHISGGIAAEPEGDDWRYEYVCEDRLIACPWHGWQFDVRDGSHVGSDDYRVPTFETVVRDGAVYVRL